MSFISDVHNTTGMIGINIEIMEIVLHNIQIKVLILELNSSAIV